MARRVAILQSNYIPWKGYFDLIDSVDEFVLYDDVQYTRRDWRNRNQIKTPQGLLWLTVPVISKGRYEQSIRETELDGGEWAANHWKTLRQNYAKAPFFKEYEAELETLYLSGGWTHLSQVNEAFLGWCAGKLGISTSISHSGDYDLPDGRSERLLGICLQAGADVYVSGPAAKDYLDESIFAGAGVGVEWFEYPSYPEYPQLWGDFEPRVSVLDLILNTGPAAAEFALPRRRSAA